MSAAISDEVASTPPSGHPVTHRASVVVRAFTTTPAGQPVLTAAAGLTSQHRLRAQAHQLACDPHADDHMVTDLRTDRRWLPVYQTPTGPTATV